VRGVNNTTGVALVEVYDLDPLILDQVSQVISASQGGTITLPSGSSVTIPGGVLPSDQLVTLSFLFSMPNQPPSGLITSVGPSLSLSFAAPSDSRGSARGSRGSTRNTGGRTPAATPTTSLPLAPFQLNLDFSDFTDPGFYGSSPLGEFIIPGSDPIFTGVDGVVDLVNKIATISLDLQAFTLQNIRQTIVYVVLSNIRPGQCQPPVPGGKFWDGSSFTSYPCASPPPGICPAARTVVFVHGILSSVEDVGSIKGAFTCFQDIQSAGHYDQVLAFDYNWTQAINVSGGQLATFLNCLRDQHFTNVDIEAHSEGVAVALSAASQTSLPLADMVLLGGPILGTPLTNSTKLVKTFLENYPAEDGDCLGGYTLQDILDGRFAQDLSLNSPVLQTIVNNFNSRSQHPTVLQVAGNVPFKVPWYPLSCGGSGEYTVLHWAGLDMTNIPYDGIIPVASATHLLYNGATLGPYPLCHIKLECNPEVIADVGNVVSGSGTPSPSPCGSPTPTATPTSTPSPTPTPPGAPSIVISSVVATIIDHTQDWTDYSVTVQGITTGTPGNYSYDAGWGVYGVINNTLTSNPENWNFTFTYTQFPGPPTIIPIWADEYDAFGNQVASDQSSVTLRY
jgi:pimeloyl-ACP methyl ester carboxylesterase